MSIHYTKAGDFPKTGDDGRSDIVHVYTKSGLEATAIYRRDGWWQGFGGDTFGDVIAWVDGIPFPSEFICDLTYYGVDEVPETLKEIKE